MSRRFIYELFYNALFFYLLAAELPNRKKIIEMIEFST